MYQCSNCGAQLYEGTASCYNCGAPQGQPVYPNNGYPEPVYQQQEPVNAQPAKISGGVKAMSIISMILGIMSCMAFCYGFIPAVPGLILSIVAKKQAPGVPNAMAKAGLITSIIGIVIPVLFLIGYLIYFLVILGVAGASSY